MKLSHSFSAFAFTLLLAGQASASPQSFLNEYKDFLTETIFTSRTQGIKAVDGFFATHYTPNAILRFTQKTTWNLPNAAPQTFDGTGKATPVSWKTQLGPQYNGEPLAFPAAGKIEKFDVVSTGITANTLETKEHIVAFYQLVPGMGGFRADMKSRCKYSFQGEKVSAQTCNAEITVTGANAQ